VAVFTRGEQIGYVPKSLSSVVAKHMEAGGICDAWVKNLTLYEDHNGREKQGVILFLGLTRLEDA
jgi:hypothetical protein